MERHPVLEADLLTTHIIQIESAMMKAYPLPTVPMMTSPHDHIAK